MINWLFYRRARKYLEVANLAFITQEVKIINPSTNKDITVNAIVDTGANSNSFDINIMKALGLKKKPSNLYSFGNNNVVKLEVAEAVLDINGKRINTDLHFKKNLEGSPNLLGLKELRDLGFNVNIIENKLEEAVNKKGEM